MKVRTKKNKGTFVISKIFQAPKDLLFKMWTDLDLMNKWWGPKGVTSTSYKMELKPEGVFHYKMQLENGDEFWGKKVYKEIVNQAKIVYTNSFSDEKGGIARHPFNEKWPLVMLTTVTFAERIGETMVRVEWTPIEPTEEERETFEGGHESMNQGWSGTFEKLANLLKEQKVG